MEFKIRKTTTKTKITRREPHSESRGGTKLQINKKYNLLILNPKVRRNSKSQFPTDPPYLSFHSLYFPKKFSSSLFSDHKNEIKKFKNSNQKKKKKNSIFISGSVLRISAFGFSSPAFAISRRNLNSSGRPRSSLCGVICLVCPVRFVNLWPHSVLTLSCICLLKVRVFFCVSDLIAEFVNCVSEMTMQLEIV